MCNEFFLTQDIEGVITKNEALKKIAILLSNRLEVDTKIVLTSLLARENIANTGLEKGIATPHVVLSNNLLNSAYLGIVTFCPPINDWKCLDDTLVEKAFCLVIPKEYQLEIRNVNRLIQVFQSLASEYFLDEVQMLKNSKDIVEILEKL